MAVPLVAPRRLTVLVLMRVRCHRMVADIRARLLHPTVAVWVAGRRLTAADHMVVAMHLLTVEVARQVDSAVADMPRADSVVLTPQAVAGAIAAEVAEGTAAVVTGAVTKI